MIALGGSRLFPKSFHTELALQLLKAFCLNSALCFFLLPGYGQKSLLTTNSTLN